MASQKGESHKCPDPNCGCEIIVTKAAAPGKGGNLPPQCYCGRAMVKK